MLLQRKNIVFVTLQISLGSLIAQKDPGSKGNLELISLISGSVGSLEWEQGLVSYLIWTLDRWLSMDNKS